MRALTLACLLVGCSTATTALPLADAAPVDDASVPDSAVPVEAGAPFCSKANEGRTCWTSGAACDGGFSYSCYSSTCPIGDVGSCTLVSDDPTAARTTVVCCERLACTRAEFPGDVECGRADAGIRSLGWSCPAGAKPVGNCIPRGSPAPAAGQAGDYCCTP